MLNLARFREFVAQSTRPYLIVTSDGRMLPVPHQDYIHVSHGLVVVTRDDGSSSRIDPLHIVSIEEMALPYQPSTR